ncbi:nucleoside deaminase [Paenibacillus sp. PR3]|uniref:Nucleoside deaminase n=1 Tax=Paenibacillus terricola TaxID=2763503 RepID=A0ABR8MU71_9BACL|nr:nucleoside deaminase [Paenibacillus terricola]MBD3919513.1 nucleoside deaminase [Paenibacillus terricola]
MWEYLTEPWKACFEEAWEAYCNGSIPIGAVLVDQRGEIISRGRNRIHEITAPEKQICSNRLAHAEINVLMQMNSVDSDILKDCILYTTTEPCILCFGAIVMSGVRTVRYAATDPVAGGTSLNSSENTFIKSRKINIKKEEKYLGEIQRVLRTDHVLRTLTKDQIERFLFNYSIDYPEAVVIGRRWFELDILQQVRMNKTPISEIINKIGNELRTVC